MPKPTKASPVTGFWLARNSVGCFLKRGTKRECQKFADEHMTQRTLQRQFPDPVEVVPERLFVECREIARLMPDLKIPISQFSIRVSQAAPTGNRVKAWWGGMDGGMAMFEEWEATLDDTVPALAGKRFRCYRCRTSELDRGFSQNLIALELLDSSEKPNV